MYPVTFFSANSISVTLVPIPKLLLHPPLSSLYPFTLGRGCRHRVPILCPLIILHSTKEFFFLEHDPATHPVCMLGDL